MSAATVGQVQEEVDRLELLLKEVQKTAATYIHAPGIPSSVKRTQVLAISRRVRRIQEEIDRELRALTTLYR